MPDLSQRLTAALADRYRIERELGRGGMATVFLAADLRHERRVAIKVLDPEVAAAIGPERFLREIATVAKLTHPHILPLFDSGTADGLLFYVMPYVEGESLRERLTREKQLPIEDALRIAREVADALSYAHAHGLVHRDIKPENVLLESGHAVVADFGIARAVAAAGGEKLTATGIAVGTPVYMSPEQATGSRDLDGRSDLYSLGCVLYEMLAGVPPFSGTTAESLAHQHLNLTPRPITELRPAVPAAVAAALQRALAKTPADRFNPVALFAEALGQREAAPPITPAPTPAAPPRRHRVRWGATIGILLVSATLGVWQGWRPLSRWLPGRSAPHPTTRDWVLVADFDAPDSSIADAVQDLVSTALNQSSLIACVPRYQIAEVLEASGRPRRMRVDPDLARELAFRRGVRAVVEGRVARLGRGYTLTVGALDVDSARVIATATEPAKNEDELIRAADRVGRALRREFGENRAAVQATRRVWLARTPSFEAVKLMRRASAREGAGDAIGMLEFSRRATQLDPEFAAAWRSMGVAWGNIGDSDSALACFRQALSFPNRMTEAERLRTEAMIAAGEDDPKSALALYDRARVLDPIAGQMNRGPLLSAFGREEEALEVYRWTYGLSGIGPAMPARWNEWVCLLTLGRTDEAVAVSRHFSEVFAPCAPPVNALVGSRWAAAESLGTLLLESQDKSPDLRWVGAACAAGALCARGSIVSCRATLNRTMAIPDLPSDSRRWVLRMWLLVDLLTGRPRDAAWSREPRDTSESWQLHRALQLASLGDTLKARRVLRALNRGRPTWRTRVDQMLAEGLIDALANRHQQVIERLGPPACMRAYEGRVLPELVTYASRWLVSRAWEQSGRADSAVAYCRLALEPGRAGEDDFFAAHAIMFPFALQRLVMLEARLGWQDEARKHWDALEALVTRPDAEFRPLLAEARTAIQSMRAMSQRKG